MAKPEWGAKRVCGGCGAPFYDLRRDPIICPKCGAKFDPEQMVRLKRSRNAAPDAKAKAAAAAPKPVAAAAEVGATAAGDEAADVVAEVDTDDVDTDDEDDTVLVGDDDLSDEDDLEEIVPKEKTVE